MSEKKNDASEIIAAAAENTRLEASLAELQGRVAAARADTCEGGRASITDARSRLRAGDVGDIEPGYPCRTKHPDHMYEIGNGQMGAHIARPTRRSLGFLLRKLEAFGCTARQLGDTEANLNVPAHAILAVAKVLKCTKARARGKPFVSGDSRLQSSDD